jgi:hypothetical protein
MPQKKVELRLPPGNLRKTKLVGIVLCVLGSPCLALFFLPNDSTSAFFSIAVYCLFPFPLGLFFLLAWYIRERYVVYFDDDQLVVVEPPLRPVILLWSEMVKVIETGKHNLQFYDSRKQRGKVFADLENIDQLVASIRTRLKPEVYADAELLMRSITFKKP